MLMKSTSFEASERASLHLRPDRYSVVSNARFRSSVCGFIAQASRSAWTSAGVRISGG